MSALAVALAAALGATPHSAAAAPGAYATRVLERPSLLSYWRLGEASGTVARDEHGARHGTYQNGVALGQAGALPGDPDTAAGFDGANDRVAVPALPASGDFTLEGWTRLDTGAATNNSVYGAFGSLRFLARPSGYYVGVWLGGVEHILQGASPANLGTWVHWAIVRAGGTLLVYRNGTVVGSRAGLPAVAMASLSGMIGTSGAYPARGGLDDLAIYSSALSAAEVNGDYAARDDTPDPPIPDTSPPETPSGVGVAALAPTAARISWQAATDDRGVTGYRVYRDGSDAPLATVTSPSFTDESLSPMSAYEYRIRAFDAAGNASAVSAPAQVTTAASSPPPTVSAPAAMAALGDSFTAGLRSGGPCAATAPCPQNSWSTGTTPEVASHFSRLAPLLPGVERQAFNLAISGQRMAQLNAQAQQAVAAGPGYVTVLMGLNDVCRGPSEAEMTPSATFRAHFQTALATLAGGLPNAKILVTSILDPYRYWEILRDNPAARATWSAEQICAPMLADPESTAPADADRRARVRRHTVDLNAALAAACSAVPACRFDANAVFNWDFESGDLAGDYFHLSLDGQRRLAAATADAGYEFRVPPPPPVLAEVAPGSYESRMIHHSPQTPGYSAWTGSWLDPDGGLVVAFTQATGPVRSPPNRDFSALETTVEYLRSADAGATFAPLRSDFVGTREGVRAGPIPFTPQATLALEDGALLRRVNGEDLVGLPGAGPGTAYLERLEAPTPDDPHPQWGRRLFLVDPSVATYQVSRIGYLRDGTLVATGQRWAVPAGTRNSSVPLGSSDNPFPTPLLMVSTDEGRTWTDGLVTDLAEPFVYANEWDTAELSNGDLLAVFRSRTLTAAGQPPSSDTTQVRNQAELVKNEVASGANPTWTLRRVRAAPFPHSGHPELLSTREGVVLHIAASAASGTSVVDYTSDGGDSWRSLDLPAATRRGIYYPTSLQGSDGRILVYGHVGGDDAYGARDQSITQDRFALRTTGAPPADDQPPAVPGDVRAEVTGPTSVELDWDPSVDDGPTVAYRVRRNGRAIVTVRSGTHLSDTQLAPGTEYSYTVVAVDAAGNKSTASDAAVVSTDPPPDTQPPSEPAPVAATVLGPTSLRITWGDSVDDRGVVKYRVYRDGAEEAIATVTPGESFRDAGLTPATEYSYTVRAVDAAGNVSEPGGPAGATTSSLQDTAAPSAPTAVVATATSPTSVEVTWQPASDNVGVAGYRVFRNGAPFPAATLEETTFADAFLSPGTSYSYVIRAFDAAGNQSPTSTPALATTPATPPGPGSYSERVSGTPGLVAYWRLGEEAGSLTRDVVSGAQAAVLNGARLGVPGALAAETDTAVALDGVDDEIALPAGPAVTDFTIEGWQNIATGAATNATLFGRVGGIRLLPRPSGYYAGVYIGGPEFFVQGATAPNTGQWVHWALVRGGSVLRLYRNGAEVATRTGLPATTPVALTGSIGRYGSIYPARASVDEVALYAAALPAVELRDHYERGR